MPIGYTAKNGMPYVTTLTLANTWYQVLTEAQVKGCRGIKIKTRMVYNDEGAPTYAPRPFDIAFSSSPDTDDTSIGDGFMSMSGSGSGDEFAPSTGVWCRSTVAGAIIEVIVYH